MKKRIKVKKLELQRETLASLVGGYLEETGPPIQDTVYSKRPDCVPLSTRCESADTGCTACWA